MARGAASRDQCPNCDGPKATWQEICDSCHNPQEFGWYAEPLRVFPQLDGMGCVYAITAANVPHSPIKFGYSTSLRSRFDSLRTSSPFQLQFIAAAQAPAKLERAIHKHLFVERMHGEWFARGPRTRVVVHWLLANRGNELLAELTSEKRRINSLQPLRYPV